MHNISLRGRKQCCALTHTASCVLVPVRVTQYSNLKNPLRSPRLRSLAVETVDVARRNDTREFPMYQLWIQRASLNPNYAGSHRPFDGIVSAPFSA